MLRLSGVALSHVGLVRSGNEDSGFLAPGCMVVADGVGGSAAGEVASATATYAVSATALAEPRSDPARVLRAGVRLAQQQVARGVRERPTRAGMATTLSAIVTDGARFALAHLGDSRGYLFRDRTLTRVTHDDTLVQRMVDDGSLAPEQAARHPWRNVVTRSVNGDVEDLGTVEELALVPGDRVLLASDGLTDLVSDEQIAELLRRHHDDAAATALQDAALVAGGRDNITCLLATVVDGPAVTSDGVLVGAVRDLDNVVDPSAMRAADSA